MTKTSRIPLWRAIATGYIELLFYFPILMTLTILLLPAATMNWWLATLPLAYCVPLAVLGAHTRIRFITRLLLILIAAAAHGAAVAMLTGTDMTPIPLIVMTLLGALFTSRGYEQLNQGWKTSFHSVHMITGIVAYMATQILKMVLIQPLSEYTGILNAGMIASIFLLLVIVNERHVTNEVVDHRKSLALKATRKQNRIWIIALMALLGLVMAFAQFRQAIEDLFRSILRAIFGRIGSGEPAPPIEEPPPPPLILPEVEPKEYRFWDYLEILIFVVFVILMAAVTVYVIKLVFKKFGHAIKMMINKLLGRRVAQPEPETGYTDEIESLMSLSDIRNRMKNKLRSLFGSGEGKNDEWNSLATNRERVRYLYRKWVSDATKHGYEHKLHLTPRETAADMNGRMEKAGDREWVHSFIEQYEGARYGDKEPGDEQVQHLRSKLQPHKRKQK
ncbi:DUF4129 domain-containing protein [Paenibacillus sp. 1011MAR3C5]|uniref:DUF4129 domain-containing protein n=1 Tax=Paenibacillus sp. 1011MAR3C5 TaxID=1675787 RepID=UPI000E6CA116|nr:DUF4129 domain-containing protein [Paenibacillus sp. 1011MAR3C5]RJE90213.1 DUF4129 domain-containing protein [Paenibacillus sp. 1011MAR3C5]